MQLKTSTQISLKFTLYVAALLCIVGLFINAVFFAQWYRAEVAKLWLPPRAVKGLTQVERRLPARLPLITNMYTMPHSDDLELELRNHDILRRLSKVDDEYVIYLKDKNNLKLVVVSHLVDAQHKLLFVTLIILSLCVWLTYVASHRFVRSSLYRVRALMDFVQGLDIHTLDKQVPTLGPVDDEIQIIADKLQESLDVIKQQTDSLSDFVSYASHELKTPLMSLSALIDVAEKTKHYEHALPKLKKQVTHLNQLFETLLLITKREFHALKLSPIDIVPLINQSIESIQHHYSHKHISATATLPDRCVLATEPTVFRMIVDNVLSNAFKFTPEDGKVTLKLSDNVLTIADTGEGIAAQDLPHVFDRFWKKTHGAEWEWYGLGLYLVKMLIEKHGRHTQLQSEPGRGTTLIISLS